MSQLPVDQYYILGDSLSDTGNFSNLTSGTFPSIPFYYPGRFTNGNLSNGDGGVWVDYLAKDLGLNIVPFTNPSSSNPINGINFAIGGATSGDYNISAGLSTPTDPNGPGLTEQVDALTGLIKSQPVNSANDDLFCFWIGANDYLARINNLPTTPKATDELLKQVVDKNISKALQKVINVGAKNIAVFNLPDLGKTPLGLSLSPDKTQILNNLTQAHNARLSNLLVTLKTLYTNVNFISIDTNTFTNNLLTQASSFGFTNTTQGATLTDLYNNTVDTTLFSPDPVTGYTQASAKADSYIYWDSVHPTTKFHSLLEDYILNTLELKLVPSPTSTVMTSLSFSFAQPLELTYS